MSRAIKISLLRSCLSILHPWELANLRHFFAAGAPPARGYCLLITLLDLPRCLTMCPQFSS